MTRAELRTMLFLLGIALGWTAFIGAAAWAIAHADPSAEPPRMPGVPITEVCTADIPVVITGFPTAEPSIISRD